MSETAPRAHFNAEFNGVDIERLTVRDKDVAREAQRWSTGERGHIVEDPEALTAADLTAFVTEAVKIGAHALSATGQAQESKALEQMLKDVGEKAADSTNRVVENTERAAKAASEVVAKAANDAKKAIVDADAASRKEFSQSVATAKQDLNAELRRIFAGDNPELLDKLQPVLDKFGTDLDAKVKAGTNDLLTKAAKQFDPSDPASPMAKHAAELEAHQQTLTKLITENHADLTEKVKDLVNALKVQEAKTKLAKVTPIKGDAFENQLNAVLAATAAGLGDEYTDVRATVGEVPRSKKGDGVLSISGGVARVVIEMTDSPRDKWTEYFDEAERNRRAGASLGVVRTAAQNGGQSIRVLGPRRIVLAFDPETDDPELVRTAVMLLRTSVLAAVSRSGSHQIATAEEKVNEALAQLAKLDEVKKAAGSIQKNATKIESSCTVINSGIHRLLSDALAALTDAEAHAPDNPDTGAVA
ncbi:Fis family transcriptional regulator [Mycolicibacterium celeriflavum]|uniref:Fis family transcriptional regulator n=1 Tax=Mycolicibacterium celeriflavum TaxID=1249101 RepID=UPI0007FC719B|nr:Fis family transcriptional regulator [Mycolicibacterium celeriflavum]OBG13668.1 Fis family transcriptional regulator [Mycolicibacterium celeriflavum]